jgi:DNA-binding transcriptional MerR regulator
MFKIGEFSKISQVSMRMLRYYDEMGLFKPAHIDRETGYRYYSAEQLPRLNRILALKDLGLSLEQITHLLNDSVEAAEIRGMLRLKRAELQQEVQEAVQRLARVESRLVQIEQEGKMPEYEIVLKKIEPQKVLSVREVAPTLYEMGYLLWETHEAARRQGLRNLSPGLAVFYDTGYEEQQVDWEVGFPVEEQFNGTIPLARGRQMSVKLLPGVELAASVIYRGSYIGLHRGYSALGAWVEANGFQLKGRGREVFLRFEPDNENNHVTEIQFPVESV